MQERSKENADIIEEYAKGKERIIQRVFGNSDSIFAQSWIFHDLFMIGYAQGFAKTFEESFTKGFGQESIESFEPEALKQRAAERRLQALRYLLPYCTALCFPDLVSQALEQAQLLNVPDQLRAMLYRLLLANTNQEARSALAVQDTPSDTSIFRKLYRANTIEDAQEALLPNG